jgi:hypothetical protein
MVASPLSVVAIYDTEDLGDGKSRLVQLRGIKRHATSQSWTRRTGGLLASDHNLAGR